MIVVFIFLIILGASYSVLSTGKTTWYSGSTQVEVQQEARKGMGKMIKELRESGSGNVNISGGGGTITFQIPVDYDNDGDMDNNGNIEWGAPLHLADKNPNCEGLNNNCHYLNYSVRYLVSGTQLLRRVLNGYPTGTQIREDVLANSLTNVLFTGNTVPPSAIDIQVTAQKNTVQGYPFSITLNSQIKLRN